MTVVNPGDYESVYGYVRELVMCVTDTSGLAKLNGVLGGAHGGRFGALDHHDWIHVLTKSNGDLALKLEDATRETYVYYTPGDGLSVHGEKRSGGGAGGACDGDDLRRWLSGHEYAKPVFRSDVPYLDSEGGETARWIRCLDCGEFNRFEFHNPESVYCECGAKVGETTMPVESEMAALRHDTVVHADSGRTLADVDWLTERVEFHDSDDADREVGT